MSTTLTTTPAADGFRMPGEFEPHSGTWLLWPERTSNWRLGAKPAQAAFAAVAAAIRTRTLEVAGCNPRRRNVL
jgi:agmatine deiminase